jgi:YfiH family protein
VTTVDPNWLVPDWPVPPAVGALITTRHGGVSAGRHASLNVGRHVGDTADAVEENRRRLCAALPGPPLWLNQVHGTAVTVIDAATDLSVIHTADAAVTMLRCQPCVVMVADCLPVLFCDLGGSCVAAAHAGWRGIAAGVLEQTVASMPAPAAQLMAYLGPAIGPDAFEVGAEVRAAFVELDARCDQAFVAVGEKEGKFRADLFQLARLRLHAAGVTKIFGGSDCTFSAPQRFFSYRRDGQTGRMAALIWLD